MKDRRTVDQIFGFVLSVSQENFALSSIFNLLRELEQTDFSQHKAMLGIVVHPQFLVLLISLIDAVPTEDDFLHKALFNLLETLASLSHRNLALLGSVPIFKPVFRQFMKEETPMKPLLLKLLKKLLTAGAPLDDVGQVFKRAVREDEVSLDSDILEIIRAGLKGKWPEHYSMEGVAAFELKEDSARGLPLTGFTFMVRIALATECLALLLPCS